MANVVVRINLEVFHAEGDEVVWTFEHWRGSMPDRGQYDPFCLQRDDDRSEIVVHQLFRLASVGTEDNGEKTAFYDSVPVARVGWFYKALPKFGFSQVHL